MAHGRESVHLAFFFALFWMAIASLLYLLLFTGTTLVDCTVDHHHEIVVYPRTKHVIYDVFEGTARVATTPYQGKAAVYGHIKVQNDKKDDVYKDYPIGRTMTCVHTPGWINDDRIATPDNHKMDLLVTVGPFVLVGLICIISSFVIAIRASFHFNVPLSYYFAWSNANGVPPQLPSPPPPVNRQHQNVKSHPHQS